MLKPARHMRSLAFVFGVSMLGLTGWANADPPSRVARLGFISGAVSFSPAGENDWVQARVNRPLTTGDRLWADAGARGEIEVGGAMIRMSGDTSVSLLNLDDRITQLQLTQGTLIVRVRRLEPDQVLEVNTPNLAFSLTRPGEFRINVDADGRATTITVRRGQGQAYGDSASYLMDAGPARRFTGTDLRTDTWFGASRPDEFDRWASGRDRRYDNSPSARYVSRDVVGYQDLDANGSWRVDVTYGNVWRPSRVAADWAPYRDGHWAWVDPWGWTWIDNAPWGFAVSHYGRWAHLDGGWAWVPGPVRSRAYYAPALVAFVGGSNFQLTVASGSVNAVAWFPLGPREVYRPWYPASRGYFDNVNQTNTVINNTVINNVYNNINVTQISYANRQVAGAVVAVPTTVFVQSQPVARQLLQAPRELVASAPVLVVAPVAPSPISVRGGSAQREQPPGRVFERSVVARSAPPPAPAGFAAQQPQLAAQPGKPLDSSTRKELKRAVDVPAPVVKLVAPTPAPTQALPTIRAEQEVPPRGNAGQQRGAEQRGAEQRDLADPQGRPALPGQRAPAAAQVRPAQPASQAQAPQQMPPALQVPPARQVPPAPTARQQVPTEPTEPPAPTAPPVPPAPTARPVPPVQALPQAVPAPQVQPAAPAVARKPEPAAERATPPRGSGEPQGRGGQRGAADQRDPPAAGPADARSREPAPLGRAAPQVQPSAPAVARKPEPAAERAAAPPLVRPATPASAPVARKSNGKNKDRDDADDEGEKRKQKP